MPKKKTIFNRRASNNTISSVIPSPSSILGINSVEGSLHSRMRSVGMTRRGNSTSSGRKIKKISGEANTLTDGEIKIEIPKTIIKRDGRVMKFEVAKIETAIKLCFEDLNRESSTSVLELAKRVVNIIGAKYKEPSVEQVQDTVELVLQAAGEFAAAKHYILYRAEHAKLREARPIPEAVAKAFLESDSFFENQIQKFQFFDKYSRFNYDLGRRETWKETVDRAVDFLHELSNGVLPAFDYERVRAAVLSMKATPSMRLLAMAGAAARRNNLCIYNCSYQPVESIDSFVEALLISMNGCGVGFSVESKYVENLPRVKRQTGAMANPWLVEDTTEGWGEAVRLGLSTWFDGGDIKFDYSALRPAGAILRVKGGRSSGPEPFKRMLEFARARILSRQGSFLRPIDAHDIMCEVGNAAVSGGMRRTAMISLFDFDDMEMRQCKSGDFERENSQRWNANNSAVWPSSGLTQLDLMKQMMDMVGSGRGEPGIFNREGAINMRPARRAIGEYGTNPCITSDTWVAVADGRGRVQIGELAADGKDVDVFTVKGEELVIRTMRNPRKTGTDVPIYRVTFADGSYIRVTPNHRFAMRDGSKKNAVELKPNDALTAITVFSYKKKGLPAVAKCDYDVPGSYRMIQFGRYRKSEHRHIYEHHTGVKLTGIEYQIHHRDFDGRNNFISNLESLSAKEHAALHRDRMLGQNNPAVRLMNDEWRKSLSHACAGAVNGNAKEISNKQLEDELVELTQKLGRAALHMEYIEFAQANGWPQVWQVYRRAYFGGNITETLQRMAIQLKLPVVELWEIEARRVTDLPVEFRSGRTYVQKRCEVCNQPFWVRLSRREQAACSQTCSQRLYYRLHGVEERRAILFQAQRERKSGVRELQVLIYNDLMLELNRHPLKQEWRMRCHERGVSSEISRVSSPLHSWRELESMAGATNHRVVSVTPDGYEDVYTGTVDETHTFFSIGSLREDSRGNTEMSYVLSWQCGEIILRPWELCNLSIAIARKEDNYETLKDKVEVAAIIGTIQSMATNFPGLRPMWKENCEEERLLGVDINGQLDSPAAQDPSVQNRLRQIAIETNRQYAAKLSINQSAAVTCVKPSGNSSQLFNCSSGIHPRWAPYYVRNIRVSAHSPIYKVLKDEGVPMDPENGQTAQAANTFVIHFPVKSPDGAVTRKNLTAIAQCEYWLQNKIHWTEHNPSVTVTYHPDEVMDVIKWVWDHKGLIGGMSFLPAFDAAYAQMPYQEIEKEEYEKLAQAFPQIDFSKLYRYEEEDYTKAAQELACVAGACDIDYSEGKIAP